MKLRFDSDMFRFGIGIIVGYMAVAFATAIRGPIEFIDLLLTIIIIIPLFIVFSIRRVKE